MKKVTKDIFDNYLEKNKGLEAFAHMTPKGITLDFKKEDKVFASYVMEGTITLDPEMNESGDFYIYDSCGQCV